MALSSIEIMEVSFNIVYLAAIYILVVVMWTRRQSVQSSEKSVANWFFLAFLLLAIGDTGHVGFRVIAYASGGLEQNAVLVGLGALSTAITITFFYMIFLEVWRVRFKQPRSILYYSLLGFGVVRLILFVFPQNQWGNLVPPFEWSLFRNIPLMIVGIGVALLFLLYGIKEDSFFTQLSIWIFVSYAFYLPVILFVRDIPMIGMLMIPKTIAYVIMAWIVYQHYFKVEEYPVEKQPKVPAPS